MKTILNTLTNTYKALKLLSNPNVATYLERELSIGNTSFADTEIPNESNFGTRNAFFHKHYIVHVVN